MFGRAFFLQLAAKERNVTEHNLVLIGEFGEEIYKKI